MLVDQCVAQFVKQVFTVVQSLFFELGRDVNFCTRGQCDGSNCMSADPRTKVQIACGFAIDCEGNEIVLRQPMTVDLWSALSPVFGWRFDSVRDVMPEPAPGPPV